MTVLVAVGDCFEAFLLGPVLQQLRTRGIAFRVAAGGPARELGGLSAQLGPDATVRTVTEDDDADRFAHDLLAKPTTCVVYVDANTFIRCLVQEAALRDVRVVRLDAGVRAFGRADRGHAWADAWCVAGDLERQVLLQHGEDPSQVFVVGDLVAAATAAVPRVVPGEATAVSIVLEHASRVSPRLEAKLALAGLPWSAPPTHDAGAAAWIAHVAAARVLVTDSVSWQRVAVALGVPCVVGHGYGLWAPGVASGLVTQAEATAEPFAAVVRRLARRPRGTPVVVSGVAERIADVVLGSAPVPTLALPSDGDASGRTFTNDEAALVAMVLQRGTLNSTRGTFVTTFEQRFARWLGTKHAIACASGSAAVHCAIAALQLQPGDEVITTPITDMGALTPVLYEGAVPVFADVEPGSLNVTAASIRAQLTERTRAIVVTHLFGLPCDLAPILALANERGIPVIEDAAQAFGATIGERQAGTFGALAVFSLQQGKHITTGEGGVVATDDDALARRVFLFVNKAWGYGDAKPDHYFPALNYRLTELQGAVAVAQLPKLDEVVARRRGVAAALRDALAGVRGLRLPQDPPHGTHSYWKFVFQVDATVIPGGAPALGKRMQAAGIACVPRYIQKPAFECELFADWRKSAVTWLPLQHNPRRERAAAMFARADYPGAVKALDDVIVLPINERYLPAHIDLVANAIRSAVQELTRG